MSNCIPLGGELPKPQLSKGVDAASEEREKDRPPKQAVDAEGPLNKSLYDEGGEKECQESHGNRHEAL